MPLHYATVEQVADFLGRTLTGAQLIQVEALIPACESAINAYTGRIFGLTTALTNELHTPAGGLVFLKHRPVASIQAVRTRSWGIGATSTALVAATSYELLDAGAGILAVSSSSVGALLSVDYTPAFPVPADVSLAAAMTVAGWLRPHLLDAGVGPDIAEYEIGQELRIKFRDDAGGGAPSGLPTSATAILNHYKDYVLA